MTQDHHLEQEELEVLRKLVIETEEFLCDLVDKDMLMFLSNIQTPQDLAIRLRQVIFKTYLHPFKIKEDDLL